MWELVDGGYCTGLGYNGSTPGPTIHVYPGDKVTIRVINHLPHRTSVHWHGLEVPNNMDGVPPLEPSPILIPVNILIILYDPAILPELICIIPM